MECSLCNVALPESSDMESHFMGKRHQKVVAGMDLRTRQEGRAVYCSRLGPLRLPQLAEYFSTFGTVVNMGAGEDKNNPGRLHHAIVEFREEGAVRKVLLQSRSKGSKALGGHKVPVSGGEEKQSIQVFERQFRERRRSPSPASCPSLDTDIVKLRLAVISQVEEQMAELVRLCYLSHEEVEERVSICRHIQTTFQQAGFPDCRVYPFGSSVSSLGFPGCDLDIFLELGSSSAVSEHQRVRDSLHLLRTIPHCSRLHPILHARVPIIKFIHRTSGVHCDISFRNRSSVANSEFIRVCTDSDPRVRELLVTLRYFCKLHGLAGGGGGLRMSNYALTLLAILFLQLVEPPLLLPVAELQNLPGLARDEIAGWNCAFPRDPALMPPLPPTPLSSLQLLQQFLAWFTSLQLHQVVLCPFLGRVISRHSLQDPAFLADNFPPSRPFLGAEGLQLDKPLCLQDPFELSHNVCRNLPLKAVNNLRNYFMAAGQLVDRMVEGQDEQLKPDGNDPEITELLPDESSPIGGVISIFEMTVAKVSEDEPAGLAELLKDCSEETKEIFKCSTKLTLSAEYVDKCNSSGEEKSLLDCISEMVREILRDCLLLEERLEGTSGALGGEDKKMALPGALLTMCPDRQCNLCGIVFNSPSISSSHYNGKAHAKKVAAAEEDMPEEQRPKKLKLSAEQSPAVNSATGLFCGTCNLVCSSRIVYDEHMKGKNHASKVRASQLAASGELAGQLMCEVCHVYAATQDILQAHIEGKAHKKKVASLGLREADLRCDLCDVTSTDRDGHDRHMGGKRHKEKLEGLKSKMKIKIPQNTLMAGESVNKDSSEAAESAGCVGGFLEAICSLQEAAGGVEAEGRVDDSEEKECGAGKRSLGREEASKKPRLEGAEVGSQQVCGGSWVVWQAVWAGRRKVLALLDPAPGQGVVAVERAVTSRLLEGGGRLEQPEVVFRLHLLPRPLEGGAVWLGLEQVYSRKKAFYCLQSWLLPFLTDTLARLARERLDGHQLRLDGQEQAVAGQED